MTYEEKRLVEKKLDYAEGVLDYRIKQLDKCNTDLDKEICRIAIKNTELKIADLKYLLSP